MGKRKSMPSQSHDKVKRNRKSEQLNNNVSNDVVCTEIKSGLFMFVACKLIEMFSIESSE